MTASRQRDQLDLYLSALGFEREYRFAPPRRFRADFRRGSLLIEYEGGVFHGDEGHRATGKYLRDIAKYNLAASLGFCVLRFTAREVDSGEAFTMIEATIARRPLVDRGGGAPGDGDEG